MFLFLFPLSKNFTLSEAERSRKSKDPALFFVAWISNPLDSFFPNLNPRPRLGFVWWGIALYLGLIFLTGNFIKLGLFPLAINFDRERKIFVFILWFFICLNRKNFDSSEEIIFFIFIPVQNKIWLIDFLSSLCYTDVVAWFMANKKQPWKQKRFIFRFKKI